MMIGELVRDQVCDQVRLQVWNRVWDQVRGPVWGPVWDQVRAQVWGRVWNQVWDQVERQFPIHLEHQARARSARARRR